VKPLKINALAIILSFAVNNLLWSTQAFSKKCVHTVEDAMVNKLFKKSLLMAMLASTCLVYAVDHEGEENDLDGYEESRSMGGRNGSAIGLGAAALGVGGLILLADESNSNSSHNHSH
jgi:hypothetical protein